MITSVPAMAASKSSVSTHCGNSAASGINARGEHRRISLTPSAVSACTSERATRECFTSPQIVTVSLLKSGRCWRMVSTSSRPWVGWARLPSPALITDTPLIACRTSSSGVPDTLWRTTMASRCMASSVCRVSNSASPLAVDEKPMSKLITSAPSRRAASSNEVRVRVDGSKNRFRMVRPFSKSSLRVPWAQPSRIVSARSSRRSMVARGRFSSVVRWRRRELMAGRSSG
jgi:hypothetical protein